MSLARVLRYVLVLIALAAAVAVAFGWTVLTRPLPLPQSPFEFEVRGGASLGSVARELEAAGALPQAWTLRLLARWRGQDRTIKAGSYAVESGVTLPQLLSTLTQGDVTQSAFVIVEGTTFAEVRKAMRATPALRNTVLDLPDADLMARLGAAGTSPEGAFHPDTYFFAAGNADVAVLKRALHAQQTRVADAWARRAPNVPLKSPAEVLVLASIVEKETGRASDRPLIASVFVNRLRYGMRLQTDPTVIYGMGERFDGNLRKRDLEADTPWNTYTRDGLPPTPIAMASQASLDAVVNPPATEFLYFVARGDGSSHFSTNLADHNRAVSKFQKGGR